LSKAPLIRVGFDPDGEKFSVQISGLHLVQADVTYVFRVAGANVEFLIQKPLRRIRVSVYNDCRVMNLTGLCADCTSRRLT